MFLDLATDPILRQFRSVRACESRHRPLFIERESTHRWLYSLASNELIG